MRKIGFLIILVLGLAVFTPTPAAAQHRYLGESGAKILQCAKFYSSVQAQLLCVRGDELSAGQIERLGLVDRNERIGQYGGYSGFDGGDGYFYHTDSSGRPMGTREKIVTGGAIGATLGAGIGAIFGRGGTGALLGASGGAIVGAISGSKANKKAKAEAEVREIRQSESERVRAEAATQVPLVIRNTTGFVARLYQNGRRVQDLRPGQSFHGVEGEYRAELRVPARGGYVELVEAELRPHERGWDIVPPSFSGGS